MLGDSPSAFLNARLSDESVTNQAAQPAGGAPRAGTPGGSQLAFGEGGGGGSGNKITPTNSNIRKDGRLSPIGPSTSREQASKHQLEVDPSSNV